MALAAGGTQEPAPVSSTARPDSVLILSLEDDEEEEEEEEEGGAEDARTDTERTDTDPRRGNAQVRGTCLMVLVTLSNSNTVVILSLEEVEEEEEGGAEDGNGGDACTDTEHTDTDPRRGNEQVRGTCHSVSNTPSVTPLQW